MSRPLIQIDDLVREMNDEELAKWEADKAVVAAQEQEAVKMAEAKAALLERLGITADEAKLLLS
jgi:hypothetical protein